MWHCTSHGGQHGGRAAPRRACRFKTAQEGKRFFNYSICVITDSVAVTRKKSKNGATITDSRLTRRDGTDEIKLRCCLLRGVFSCSAVGPRRVPTKKSPECPASVSHSDSRVSATSPPHISASGHCRVRDGLEGRRRRRSGWRRARRPRRLRGNELDDPVDEGGTGPTRLGGEV